MNNYLYMGNNLIKKKKSRNFKKKKLKRHISNSIGLNRYNNDIKNYNIERNNNELKVYDEEKNKIISNDKQKQIIKYIVYPTQIVNYPYPYPMQSYPYPMQSYSYPIQSYSYPIQSYPLRYCINEQNNRKNQDKIEEYDIPTSISRQEPTAPPLYN